MCTKIDFIPLFQIYIYIYLFIYLLIIFILDYLKMHKECTHIYMCK